MCEAGIYEGLHASSVVSTTRRTWSTSTSVSGADNSIICVTATGAGHFQIASGTTDGTTSELPARAKTECFDTLGSPIAIIICL